MTVKHREAPGARDAAGFDITFPETTDGSLDQNEEWFELASGGRRRRLRVHDYAAIYSIPGLYEALVYDALQCRSPQRIVRLLQSVLLDWPEAMGDLRVLDLGAGNGIVAERLRECGAEHIVGLDLLPEAQMAARRDRPEVYDDYLVADLTSLTADQRARLEKHRFNCLITVAALGFGDIPADAFAAAYDQVRSGGWVAMTIKEDFLDAADQSGFARLVRKLISDGDLEIQARQRYCHRISITGDRLFYVALVGRKR